MIIINFYNYVYNYKRLKFKYGEIYLIKKNNGFTLIEIIVVLAIFGILLMIVFPISTKLYETILLETTANKIKSTLLLAQTLSLDQSKEYCVELSNNGHSFRLREAIVEGRIVLVEELDKKIEFDKKQLYNTIKYNRNGITSYGKFIIKNKQEQMIDIETYIGTGRVNISKIYKEE